MIEFMKRSADNPQLMYYSSTLFAIVGFSNPIAVGTVIAVVNWVVSFTPITS